MDPSDALFVAAVVLVAGTAQTVAGFGFALIAVPLLVTVLDVRDVVVVTSLLAQLNSTLVLMTTRAHVPRRIVATLLAGAFAGMPLGLAVLLLAPADALRIAVGVSSVVMAVALASGVEFGGRGLGGELFAGMTSGVLATSTGMNGPPVVLYLQHRRLPPSEFRGGLAAFFFVSGAVSLAAFAASGVIAADALVLAVAGVPSVVAGNWLGHRLVGLLSAEAFRRLVLALLVATAVAAVVTASARIAS